ncbi:MAG: hypothetical protein ACFFDF_07070 [Candidatus Odinarchaeota archaeon]
MIETEYSNKIKTTFRDERFGQIELLFKVYKLRNNREKLRKKLRALERMINKGKNENLTNKIEAIKIISAENSIKFKNVMSGLNISYNIFKLLKDQENNHQYLANLDKARKKRRIDAQEYEIAKGFYLQKIIDINNCLNQLKETASLYFKESKANLIQLEDQRIRLSTEKLRKRISKQEFNQKYQEIEILKHQIEEKMAFLQVEIIDLDIK